MPIEFRCPSCDKLLRTPDQSAGKKAKCPQCGTITNVPVASTASGPVGSTGITEDLPQFSPPPAPSGSSANPFGQQDFSSEPFPGALDLNPYASPAQVPAGKSPLADEHSETQGLPWEHEKSVRSFWETVKLVFTSPNIAFSRMHRLGGFGDPILFAIAGGLIGGLLSAVYNSMLQLVLLGFAGAAGGEEAAMVGGMIVFQIVMQFVAGIAGGTIGVIMGCFISAALQHVCLLILGEKNLPYETTFRVGAFVTGTTSLLQVVPFCGAYVYGLVGLVYTILGLAAAHRISTGKAAAGVLLPLLICAVVAGVIVAIVVAFVAAAAANA